VNRIFVWALAAWGAEKIARTAATIKTIPRAYVMLFS
jgi:hypothetical protein